MDQSAANFKKLIEKFPQLTSVLSKINEAQIKYGLYAGSHVFVLSANRPPIDVDFLVADEDFAKLKELFPASHIKDIGNAKFIYLDGRDDIEFMSFADVNAENSHYNFRLTNLCWENSSSIEGENFKVKVLNEVDTILLKAMLQRGEDIGKHDIEDIETILKYKTVDKEYLQKRLLEVNQDERLLSVLKKFELI